MIETLKPYLMGWRGYFGFCQTPRVLTNLEAWIRRRLRRICGDSGGHKRFVGAPPPGTLKGPSRHRLETAYWRMAGHVVVQQALRNHHFDSLGLPRLYPLLRPNSVEPPWYGPVCPVVWEGRHREMPPYPDRLSAIHLRFL